MDSHPSRVSRRRSPRRRSTVVVVPLAAAAVIIAGCGSTDGADASGPTVAPARAGGTYQLERLLVRGEGVAIDSIGDADGAQVTIDAEFGGLRIDTACGVLLGSFSLLDDGRAGFTVAGGSTSECSEAAEAQRDQLLAALGRIEAWEAPPADARDEPLAGLEFTSPDGDVVTVAR